MIERVPAKLRSAPMIRDFFEKLFRGGQVYDADIMFDMSDLDTIARERFEIRNKLEKHIAIWKATGKHRYFLFAVNSCHCIYVVIVFHLAILIAYAK